MSDSHFKRDVFRATGTNIRSPLRILFSMVRMPGLIAVAIFRFQSILYRRGNIRAASMLRVLNNAITGADLLPGATIGSGMLLPHPTGVVIGSGAKIGRNCTILQNVTIGEKFADGSGDHRYPVLGDNVVIGAGAVIIGGVHVGADVTVGANSVVRADVPSGAVAVGVPAHIMQAPT